MRGTVAAVVSAAALVFAPSAFATPPTLVAVGHDRMHPWAEWTLAPGSDAFSVEIASAPVELGTGTVYVVDAKTAKGVREVHLTPAMRDELAVWRATSKHARPSDYVVSTSTGRKHNPSNLRRDVLAPAISAANANLEEVGIAPIGRVTFHSLRRTYASLRCACGDDVRYTADQLGHEDPRFTLRVYAQATKRRDRLSGPHLAAYDRALEWAQMGTSVTVPEVEKVSALS